MIQIDKKQIEEIQAHGERDYPFECCGLLIGSFTEDGRKIVSEIYAISNAREEEAKRARFLIEPEELLRGERYARERKLDVIGFYHSHPEDRGVPSGYDLEHAWPTYSYVIVPVTKGKAETPLSWELEADRSKFNEEEIF